MALTDTTIKIAKARNKPAKIFDERGLWLMTWTVLRLAVRWSPCSSRCKLVLATRYVSPQCCYVATIRSASDLATRYFAGASPTASALKCAFPHSIFALSLSRKSSVNRLLFVSTTR